MFRELFFEACFGEVIVAWYFAAVHSRGLMWRPTGLLRGTYRLYTYILYNTNMWMRWSFTITWYILPKILVSAIVALQPAATADRGFSRVLGNVYARRYTRCAKRHHQHHMYAFKIYVYNTFRGVFLISYIYPNAHLRRGLAEEGRTKHAATDTSSSDVQQTKRRGKEETTWVHAWLPSTEEEGYIPK
jgi:hypothetical protein